MSLKEESVWKYPRPASCEFHEGTIEVIVNNVTIAKTKDSIRVIETSHPPTYYFPIKDIEENFLKKNRYTSFCEWKGWATYYDLLIDDIHIPKIGWGYLEPNSNFINIKNFISFYASKTEKCFVNGELVKKQEGNFYGGWITSNLKGPFKGGPETSGW